MAQRDIEAIAEQMRLEEEQLDAENEAFERAQAEEKQLEAEEFEQIEDEIIDPASMGFIDSESEDIADESDAFYNETEDTSTLDEDVSDCLKTEDTNVDEAEGTATIEVDVYNEDGFGEHFASEVMKNIPGVVAKANKVRKPDGSIVVKISGSRDDLEKAFAFYLGQKDYMLLPKEDREEFESLLVFDDGDTLAEADYREAVAHCLDPIGVNASTADLVAQDTCAINLIKEERARRSAKKMLKALCEEDMSDLTDKELDQLEGIQDALASGEGVNGMTDEERRVWDIVRDSMGYSQEEWDKMTPEQQSKAIAKSNEIDKKLHDQLSKSGFARWRTITDPKTGKLKQLHTQDELYDPQTGDVYINAFNADYTQDKSPFQHPTTYDKEERKAAVQADKERVQRQREEYARKAMLHSRSRKDSETGKLAITPGDFGRMISNLSNDEVENLRNSLIDYAKSTAKNAEDAKNEEAAVNAIFSAAKNKKTLDDLSNIMTGGRSPASAIKRFIREFDLALQVATFRAGGNISGDRKMFEKLISTKAGAKRLAAALETALNAHRTGKNPLDPDRASRRKEWLSIIKSLGFSQDQWERLPTEEQMRLMDQHKASHSKQA